LYVFGIHSRQRDPAVVGPAALIDVSLDARSESCTRFGSLSITGRPAVQHAIEDLIEVASKIEEILKETTTGNQVSHDIPPNPKRNWPLGKRWHVMAQFEKQTENLIAFLLD